MIRHQQVVAHKPRLRLEPGLTQEPMRNFICQPRITFLRGHSEENEVGLAEIDADAGGGVPALRDFVFCGIVHGLDIMHADSELEELSFFQLREMETAREYARPTGIARA